MPPNRCWWLPLLLFSLIISFAATVYAHQGGTDENGGHTDHSTGEYHYHHGYPAHDHYDIDGDGKIDCPYDFDDKTGHNSGAQSSENSGCNQVAQQKTNTPTTTHNKSQKIEFSEIIFSPPYLISSGICGVFVFVTEHFDWTDRLKQSGHPLSSKALKVSCVCMGGFASAGIFIIIFAILFIAAIAIWLWTMLKGIGLLVVSAFNRK